MIINPKDKEQIEYLAEEYNIDQRIVEMLYDLMPSELYDGIPNILEDGNYAF